MSFLFDIIKARENNQLWLLLLVGSLKLLTTAYGRTCAVCVSGMDGVKVRSIQYFATNVFNLFFVSEPF